MLIKVKKIENMSINQPTCHISLFKEFPAAITTTLSLSDHPSTTMKTGKGGGRLN
jgi:hypothetical protein